MDKLKRRARRRKSIRKKIYGTAVRPRLCVHKSNRNIYVQLVDDIEGKTICGISTNSNAVRNELKAKTRKNLNFAELIGKLIAENASEKGITEIVFDRAGYVYHGRIKAIAESARKNGLKL